MSDAHDILLAIVQDRAPGTADTVLNLTQGGSFTAEIEGNLDAFTVPETLGNDPRAKIRLHVADVNQAAAISMNDLVQFTLFGVKTKAQIVYRDYDPASPQTKFIAAHVLPKDQT